MFKPAAKKSEEILLASNIVPPGFCLITSTLYSEMAYEYNDKMVTFYYCSVLNPLIGFATLSTANKPNICRLFNYV